MRDKILLIPIGLALVLTIGGLAGINTPSAYANPCSGSHTIVGSVTGTTGNCHAGNGGNGGIGGPGGFNFGSGGANGGSANGGRGGDVNVCNGFASPCS